MYAAVDDLFPKKGMVPTSQTVTSTILDPITGKPYTHTQPGMAPAMVGGAPVNFAPIKALAKDIDLEIGKAAGLVRKLGGPDKSVLSLTEALQGTPDRLNFREAQIIRSQLLKAVRGMKDTLPDKYIGIGKKITSLIDQEMETGATSLDPRAYRAWRAANEFTKARHALFDRTIVGDLLDESSPELIGEKLKATHVTDARAITQAFRTYEQYASPQQKVQMQKAFGVFQQRYLADLVADPSKITKSLTAAKPTLDVLMTDPKARAALSGLRNLGILMDRMTPVKGASHWLLYETIGHATGLTLGYATAGAASVPAALAATETAPYILARILYNPTAKKFLMEGVGKSPGGGQGGPSHPPCRPDRADRERARGAPRTAVPSQGEPVKALTRYTTVINQVAEACPLPADLLESQVVQESSGDPYAFRYEPAYFKRYILDDPTTPENEHPQAVAQHYGPLAACSYGLLRILLETAEELGFSGHPEELFNPKTGLWWGAKKMRALWDWAGGTPSDYPQALAAYNGGPGITHGGPPYPNQAYVDHIYSRAGVPYP